MGRRNRKTRGQKRKNRKNQSRRRRGHTRRQRGGSRIPDSIPYKSVVILDLDPKDDYSVPVVTSKEEADEEILGLNT
jgi:hypothetical protein